MINVDVKSRDEKMYSTLTSSPLLSVSALRSKILCVSATEDILPQLVNQVSQSDLSLTKPCP